MSARSGIRRVGRGLVGVSAGIGLAVVAAGLGACSSGPRIVENGAIGHPISIDASAWVYILKAELPNPGWSFELDRVRDDAGVHEAFVSVREPDPSKVFVQQIVTKSVGLGVTAGEPLRVFARQVPFEGTGGGGYVPAGTHGLQTPLSDESPEVEEDAGTESGG